MDKGRNNMMDVRILKAEIRREMKENKRKEIRY